MKTQIILLIGMVLFIYISCKKDEPVSQPQQQTDPRIGEVKQKLQGRWIGHKWINSGGVTGGTQSGYVTDSCLCSFDLIFKGDSLFKYRADTLKIAAFLTLEVYDPPLCSDSDKDYDIISRTFGGEIIEFLDPDTLYFHSCPKALYRTESWYKKDTTYNN